MDRIDSEPYEDQNGISCYDCTMRIYDNDVQDNSVTVSAYDVGELALGTLKIVIHTTQNINLIINAGTGINIDITIELVQPWKINSLDLRNISCPCYIWKDESCNGLYFDNLTQIRCNLETVAQISKAAFKQNCTISGNSIYGGPIYTAPNKKITFQLVSSDFPSKISCNWENDERASDKYEVIQISQN